MSGKIYNVVKAAKSRTLMPIETFKDISMFIRRP